MVQMVPRATNPVKSRAEAGSFFVKKRCQTVPHHQNGTISVRVYKLDFR